MTLLERYLGKIVNLSILLTLLFLTLLRSLFAFIDDLPNIGKGSYSLLDALWILLLNAPGILYEFFPMACLIGAIAGLGSLANSSELIVIRAGGVSPLRILRSVVVSVIPFMVIVLLLGEFIAPMASQFAEESRSVSISGGQLISSRNGIWARDKAEFVHIGRVLPGRIENVERYKFDHNLKLVRVIHAQSGTYTRNGVWVLTGISGTDLSSTRINKWRLKSVQWKSQLTPDTLGVVGLQPSGLGIAELWRYANYLEENKLDAGKFNLEFWRKTFLPITVIVMLMIGASFVFGSVRHVSMGARILAGVLLGLGFWALNDVFGPISLVYNLPPLLGSVIPLLLFMGLGIWRMRCVH